MTNILPTQNRDEYERRKVEWGEHGPAHNVGYKVTVQTRNQILLNHTGNVPQNSMEQQKKRGLTLDYSVITQPYSDYFTEDNNALFDETSTEVFVP